MSQKLIEKKIAYSQLIADKKNAIVAIKEALDEIELENFNVRQYENSPSLETIANAVKTLYQTAYASSLIIVEETE